MIKMTVGARDISATATLTAISFMNFDPTTHPHRRHNPLTGEHVLVSPHRTKRPWRGQTEQPQSTDLPQYDPDCYLCPGNTRAGGHRNEVYEHTTVFTNDFAAILPPPGPTAPPVPHHLLKVEPVQGGCDVIVWHPRHDLTLARLPIPNIERIIEEWCAVYTKRGAEDGIKYIQIFEVRVISLIILEDRFCEYASRTRVRLWAAQTPIRTARFGPCQKSLLSLQKRSSLRGNTVYGPTSPNPMPRRDQLGDPV